MSGDPGGTVRTPRRASVLMLAYGEEAYLHDAVAAVLASQSVEIEVVLVDNGATTNAVATLPPDPRVRVLTPPRNLGFAGGMNHAAEHAGEGPLVLVNSDAVVAPEAIVELLTTLDDPAVGIATACVVLGDSPDTVNSVGNPLHVLGLCWAGGLGEPVAAHQVPGPVTSASGACAAVDRALWERLGGFPAEFFAYMEDLELSWRVWQHGRTVRYVPSAVAAHHYDFGRSPLKMYLLERNRLVFVLTCYGARMLLLLAVPLLGFELAIFAVAVAQGWGRQKARGWLWLLTHPGAIARRRRIVQASRVVADRDLTPLITDTFDATQVPLPAVAAPAQWLLRWWWWLVRRWV